jgi:hypothetical protein
MLSILKEYQTSSQYEVDYKNRYAEPSLYTWSCPSCMNKVIQVPKYHIEETTVFSAVICNCGTTFEPCNNGRMDIGPYDTPELMFLVSTFNYDINVGKFQWIWNQLPTSLKYAVAFKLPSHVFAYYWDRISDPNSLTQKQLEMVYNSKMENENVEKKKAKNVEKKKAKNVEKTKVENVEKKKAKNVEKKKAKNVEKKKVENVEKKKVENVEKKKVENVEKTKVENKNEEMENAEKSCRDLLQTIYSIGDLKISVDWSRFIEEAKKLRKEIEETIKEEIKLCKVEKSAKPESLAHKRIPDDIYDQLPSIPEEDKMVHFTYPWNSEGERYFVEWNRHYNGAGKPFTLPTRLV